MSGRPKRKRKRKPKLPVIGKRHSYACSSGEKLWAELSCGHTVHIPKSVDFEEGVGVHCTQCPPRRAG